MHYLLFLFLLLFSTSASAQRLYDSAGHLTGRTDGDRFYDAAGKYIGRVVGNRLYDGSGRQIARADGLQQRYILIFFYFFM